MNDNNKTEVSEVPEHERDPEPAYPLSDEEEEKAEKDLYYRFPM
jgi:hypothetical protein